MDMENAIQAAIDHAVNAIPPAWPLSATVAVNPFLGHSESSLSETDHLLRALTGTAMIMPADHYAHKVASGEIIDTDIELAMKSLGAAPDVTLDTLKADLSAPQRGNVNPIPTLADLAAAESGIDWPAIITERLGMWASAYFDEGQALWAAPCTKRAYTEWRAVATHDLTPEVLGLEGFGAFVAAMPDKPQLYIERAVARLGLSIDALPSYFHQLLLGLGGWAQAARYKLWQAELKGDQDATTHDLLAIRLAFEEALYAQYKARIERAWEKAILRHSDLTQRVDQAKSQRSACEIWQLAAEYADQRTLAEILQPNIASAIDKPNRPKLQAAFCIDVRSEVFRRTLETQDPAIETIGFAGFFGIGASHKGFASDIAEHRLPVLLNAGVESREGSEADQEEDQSARFTARAKRAWGRFKLAAISSFAFVETMGPIYANRLLKDSLYLDQHPKKPRKCPEITTELSLEDKVHMATTILTAMGLIGGKSKGIFAPIILVVGHGAATYNNPFNSALHCGACGGHAGDVNVRLLAGLLNDADLRSVLETKGVDLPKDTYFVPALHNTTTDEINLFDVSDLPAHAAKNLQAIQGWLDQAGRLTRAERALHLPGAENAGDIHKRSRNWAEIRPEWGLAGCSAFIAAPRSRTSGKALKGRAFLHDYHWQKDTDFKVLELILTAPVVVASWISLQYYGSAVAPDLFGSGNKLLHNVSGGMGVVEGNGGTLRTGLPWQSVHDGEKLVHDPLRLTVYVEARVEAINDILSHHEGVRALFDNGWLHLITLDENGQMARRYGGGLTWTDAFARNGMAKLQAAA